jgi:hypothetical protein
MPIEIIFQTLDVKNSFRLVTINSIERDLAKGKHRTASYK